MSNRTSFPANVSLVEHKQIDAKGKAVTLKVASNSDVVQVHSDYSIWDTASNAYVHPEDTNVFAPK